MIGHRRKLETYLSIYCHGLHLWKHHATATSVVVAYHALGYGDVGLPNGRVRALRRGESSEAPNGVARVVVIQKS